MAGVCSLGAGADDMTVCQAAVSYCYTGDEPEIGLIYGATAASALQIG
jgi:hypothetical protein